MLDNKRRRLVATGAMGTAAAALGLPIVASAQQRTRGIVGQMAPELDVGYWINPAGEPGQFSVDDSRGKWVLLKCFQNWCPGCHKSGFPTLKAFADRFVNHPDVTMAAVQTVFEGHRSNTQEDVRKLQLRYDLPIVMGHDPGDPETHDLPSTMKSYRTGGTPWLILIAPDGVVAFDGFHVDSEKLIDFVESQVS